jgi:hypothetical protein
MSEIEKWSTKIRKWLNQYEVSWFYIGKTTNLDTRTSSHSRNWENGWEEVWQVKSFRSGERAVKFERELQIRLESDRRFVGGSVGGSASNSDSHDVYMLVRYKAKKPTRKRK